MNPGVTSTGRPTEETSADLDEILPGDPPADEPILKSGKHLPPSLAMLPKLSAASVGPSAGDRGNADSRMNSGHMTDQNASSEFPLWDALDNVVPVDYPDGAIQRSPGNAESSKLLQLSSWVVESADGREIVGASVEAVNRWVESRTRL